MRLEQTGDELILRSTRGFSWLFGLTIFAVFGAALYNGSDRIADDDGLFGISTFAFVLGSIGLAFILFNFLPFVKITTRANRIKQRVTIERISLFGKKVTDYEFAKIRQFKAIENSRDEDNFRSVYYEIVLILTDGTHVQTSNSYMSSRERCDETVQTLNDFVRSNTL